MLITVPLLHIQLSLKDHPEWLWAVVAASTTLFVISAAFLYLSRRQIIDVVEQHYARSLEQLVFLSLRVPDPRAPIATRIFLDHGLTGLTTGCRRGTLTATSFANAITALVGGLGAAFFLFRIDLPLTLLIVVAAVLGALLLYPLTLRAAKSAKDRDKAQTVLRSEIRKLNEDLSVEPTATSLKSVDEVSRVYMMRRRVLTELIFATEIGITIIARRRDLLHGEPGSGRQRAMGDFHRLYRRLAHGAERRSPGHSSLRQCQPLLPSDRSLLSLREEYAEFRSDAPCQGGAWRQGGPRHASQWSGCRRRSRRSFGATFARSTA